MLVIKRPEASLAIQILPTAAETEIVRIVDKVIEYIRGTGLPYMVGPFETTLEGGFEELCEVAKQCQLVCIAEGAPGLAAYMKMFYSPTQGVLGIGEKVDKYQG